MRDTRSADGRGMVVIIIWLLDAGVGIGLYGQGHFLQALLALALAPPAIMLSLYLTSASQSLRRAGPNRDTSVSRPRQRVLRTLRRV